MPPTILVADDEPDVRDFVEIKLRRAGMNVVTASDGRGALVAVDERHPDLVVLDIMMPGLSGIDVMREMQAGRTAHQPPVILLTARAQEADVELGFAVGAVDYVTKPFSPRELLFRINAILGRVSA
jgi:DNA-binding response OmpR family regulator